MDLVAYLAQKTEPDNIVVRWGNVAITANNGVATRSNNTSGAEWKYIPEATLEQCRQAPWE